MVFMQARRNMRGGVGPPPPLFPIIRGFSTMPQSRKKIYINLSILKLALPHLAMLPTCLLCHIVGHRPSNVRKVTSSIFKPS